MPDPDKPPSLKKRLIAEYPQAADLAWKRIFTERKKTFFDSKHHKARYEEGLIVAALYLANQLAHRAGAELDLNSDEKKLWRQIFRESKGIEPE